MDGMTSDAPDPRLALPPRVKRMLEVRHVLDGYSLTDDDVNAIFAAGVEQERERCAKLVEQWHGSGVYPLGKTGFTNSITLGIASAIRAAREGQ